VEVTLGSKAIGVDISGQTVRLEGVREIGYDNLLIATGASPIQLDGSEKLSNVFSVRNIEDAERILQCAKTASQIIVIGAGLISLQVCDALFKKGVKVTVIEALGQVLPESVDVECASLIQKQIESYGISVLLRKRVKRIGKEGKKVVVILDLDEELIADMVVVGVGVRPNIELVSGSCIEVDKGILVDESMRTNVGNVFAAGDVSEGMDVVTGKRDFIPTWGNACRQGRIAGLNMGGCEERYIGGLRETITSIFGLTVGSVGLCKTPGNSGVKEVRFLDSKKRTYRKIMFADNKMVGAVLLGGTKEIGILANLIRNGRDISHWNGGMAKVPLDMRRILLSMNSC
jgi:NAD(P)H-nitrite reductase large subunit